MTPPAQLLLPRRGSDLGQDRGSQQGSWQLPQTDSIFWTWYNSCRLSAQPWDQRTLSSWSQQCRGRFSWWRATGERRPSVISWSPAVACWAVFMSIEVHCRGFVEWPIALTQRYLHSNLRYCRSRFCYTWFPSELWYSVCKLVGCHMAKEPKMLMTKLGEKCCSSAGLASCSGLNWVQTCTVESCKLRSTVPSVVAVSHAKWIHCCFAHLLQSRCSCAQSARASLFTKWVWFSRNLVCVHASGLLVWMDADNNKIPFWT